MLSEIKTKPKFYNVKTLENYYSILIIKHGMVSINNKMVSNKNSKTIRVSEIV